MILAAETSNLPTVISIVAALAAVGATIVTAVVAITNIKPTRKKTSAEADKVAAEATFQGGSYIKELSEAASSLVTPLRNENEKLQARVQTLEVHVRELQEQADSARRELREEHDQGLITKEAFQKQIKDLTNKYQRQIAELKAKIAELEASSATESTD